MLQSRDVASTARAVYIALAMHAAIIRHGALVAGVPESELARIDALVKTTADDCEEMSRKLSGGGN